MLTAKFEALQRKPDRSIPADNLRKAQGHPAEARACYEQALRWKPDLAAAHLNLGVALAKQNRLEEARAEFRETLRLAPTNKSAQEYLSRLEARPAPAPR